MDCSHQRLNAINAKYPLATLGNRIRTSCVEIYICIHSTSVGEYSALYTILYIRDKNQPKYIVKVYIHKMFISHIDIFKVFLKTIHVIVFWHYGHILTTKNYNISKIFLYNIITILSYKVHNIFFTILQTLHFVKY